MQEQLEGCFDRTIRETLIGADFEDIHALNAVDCTPQLSIGSTVYGF